MMQSGLLIAFSIFLFILILLFIYTRPQNVFHDYYYFDNNGTTELSSDVKNYMDKNAYLGNASASYADKARHVISSADDMIRYWTQCNYKILYTSGGSESINLYINSVVNDYSEPINIITTATDHKTTLECFKFIALKNTNVSITIMPTHKDGLICGECILEYLKPNTKLVSIIHGNNETGLINPLSEIVQAVKKYNSDIKVHIDAVQTFGKFRIQLEALNIDALSLSAHKFNGPTGVGALIHRDNLSTPFICGSQQYGIRGGTENIMGIAGLFRAVEHISKKRYQKNITMYNKIKYIYKNITLDDIKAKFNIYTPQDFTFSFPLDATMNSKGQSPNTLFISFISKSKKQFCNVKFKEALLKNGVIISIGSACNTSSKNSSHVLDAMGLSPDIKRGILRISVGDLTSWWATYRMVSIFRRLLLEF